MALSLRKLRFRREEQRPGEAGWGRIRTGSRCRSELLPSARARQTRTWRWENVRHEGRGAVGTAVRWGTPRPSPPEGRGRWAEAAALNSLRLEGL